MSSCNSSSQDEEEDKTYEKCTEYSSEEILDHRKKTAKIQAYSATFPLSSRSFPVESELQDVWYIELLESDGFSPTAYIYDRQSLLRLGKFSSDAVTYCPIEDSSLTEEKTSNEDVVKLVNDIQDLVKKYGENTTETGFLICRFRAVYNDRTQVELEFRGVEGRCLSQ